MTIERFDPAADGWGSPAPETVLIGPPGTGKTRQILDAWIVPALRDRPPQEVLACSFTRAAAGELAGRVAKATGLNDSQIRGVCKTIHSEALRVVGVNGGPKVIWKDSMAGKGRDLGTALGEIEEVDEDPPLLVVQGTDPDREIECRWERLAVPSDDLVVEARRVWSLGCNLWPDDVGRPALLVERVVRERGSTHRPDAILLELARYAAMKKAAGALDFTDMLLLALQSPAPRRELLLVDEAQDLSPLQVRLVEHWGRAADHLVWIGDPDQGIYGFAGADGLHLTGLIRSGSVRVRSLQQSWRVPSAPLALARLVILKNRDREDAPYLPTSSPGFVDEVRTVDDAVDAVADLRVESSDPAVRRTVFVLARSARILGPYAQELVERGIPFRAERGGGGLVRGKLATALRALHSIFGHRQITAPDALALLALIPGRPRWPLLRRTKKEVEAALKALPDGALFYDLPGVDCAALRDCEHEEEILRSMGAKSWGQCEPLLRVVQADGWAALDRDPAVTLTTIHASKGREADAVVLDLDVPFPTRRALEQVQGAEEEERRLLYVGMTRTKDSLLLVRHDRDLGDRLCGGLEVRR